MSYDYVELESRVVTVRKNHHCSWCTEKIVKGSRVVSTSYVFDGALQRDWMHPECIAAYKRIGWDDYPDDIMLGEFVRGETYVHGEEPGE